ncbi:MAG: glycosyltransferase [Drouetiella hepatica Uher 2000/2452]|jgi:glycosyltransferase involved in cell wall biosynthesis|uniref:Glycosyltransferase n=1 Tax=Drouetiella hepatica Uher 2000/2452 TaxID=904376 RepID=A0A951QAY1_9CYAN|nr:glycosyltransferase [Drouetiella hepatica Uher 2000/2452]
MKLLLSAYACEPNRGSEEGVGWNVVMQAAKHHEVWVLTRSFYRSAVEAELNRQQLSNLHFIYFDPFNWTADWRDTQGAVQFHYYLWQIQAYFIGRSLQKEIKFDVIRHVTYVKYWSPSFLSLLSVPFIWGPVGGGESAPKPFWKDFSLYGQTYETLRTWAQRIGELDPFTRMTARRSLLAQATTDDTAKRLAYLGAQNIHLCSESGLSKDEIERLAQQPLPPSAPIRFISMGRLLHWKAYHLSIMAFHTANIPDAEYWLLGNGSERKRLEALCEKLNISSQVKFFGRLPREETLARLAQCHVLVHPSLHDSGGWTCLEGMAAGRPVICLNLGGPAMQVTHETGIKVPAHNPEQTIQDLANAMNRLAQDAELRLRLGQAGQQRVKDEFSWDAIGQAFDETYKQIAKLAS